jgi:hypothetical protein
MMHGQKNIKVWQVYSYSSAVDFQLRLLNDLTYFNLHLLVLPLL